jgi:hypothetical protein
MNQQQEVNDLVHQMSNYLSGVAKRTDGPGASRPGTSNFEARASAHRYMKTEANRIISLYPRASWEHQASFLERWAEDNGYRG